MIKLEFTKKNYIMKLFIVLISLAIAATASSSIRLRNDVTESNTRVINGRNCDKNEVPYQVAILHNTLLTSSHICGGVLISKRHVLTAASCKKNSGSYTAVLGRLVRDALNLDGTKMAVASFVKHQDFKGGISKYDIGILTLKKEAKITSAIQIINLPSSESECDDVSAALLSGWGDTGSLLPIPFLTLQCAELPIISNEECGRNLTSLQGNAGPLDDTMICTGTTTGRNPQSGCNGDEGGPLADRANNTIIGIYSWGLRKCGTRGAPSVYTNVCSYIDWIQDQMF